MGQIKISAKKIDWANMEVEYDAFFSMLYSGRKDVVNRFKNKKAKLTSTATGLLLQEIVERELGIRPDALIVRKGEQGKPYIDGHPEFHFNISHSGDMIAIAYGDSNVGIDVEHIRCRENDLKVAKRCFAEEEYEFITDDALQADMEGISHPIEERFFMVWTMKEAYLKYKGTGINVPMNSFLVKPYEGAIVGEKLSCQPVVINDYVYSVCVDEGVEVSINFE